MAEVPRRPEEVTRYELAVTLSHKEVWRRLVESGDEWCCVLEDDVLLMRRLSFSPSGLQAENSGTPVTVKKLGNAFA